MPAKPVVLFGFGLAALGAFAAGAAPVQAKAPLPTVLLYPASPSDVSALVDLRTRLRLDGVFQVLTYDPDSASVKRVAADFSHPEWLVAPALTDDARLALARALETAFYIVVSPGREAGGTHLELVETAPPALTFDWQGVNRQFGARALESQAQAALAQEAAAANAAVPAPLVIASALPAPSPEPVPEVTPVVPLPVTAPVVPVPRTPAVQVAPVLPPVVPPVVQPPPVAAPLVITLPTTLLPKADLPVSKPLPTPEVAPAPVVKAAPILPSVPAIAAPPPVVVVPVPVIAPMPIVTPSSVITPRPPVVVVPPLALPVAAPVITAPPIAPALPTTGTQMALLPPRPLLPEPTTLSTTPSPFVKPQAKTEDLTAVSPLLTKGDVSLEGGDVVGAISLYRQAVNGAPLSVVPRLKLAQAYQKGGLTDKALDEAKRALEIAPDNLPVQQFLTDLDQQNGTSDGALARYHALIERNPDDPDAHSGLASALWNSGDLGGAEAEYKTAKKLAAPDDHTADAHLAQLYATQARYDDCLAALQEAGKGGYALAIRIVRNRSDTLSSTLEASQSSFTAGTSTREQFYKAAQLVSAQAQALAAFVARITPPAEYKLSHLHRMLSTNLLAQEAATLVTFIETGDAAQSESVSRLDKEAQTEMLTAQATEEKLGLWEAKP